MSAYADLRADLERLAAEGYWLFRPHGPLCNECGTHKTGSGLSINDLLARHTPEPAATEAPDATTADGDAPTQRPHAPDPIAGGLPTCTCGRTFWSWRAQGIHETQANHRIERGEGDE